MTDTLKLAKMWKVCFVLFPHDSRIKLSQKPNKQGKSKNATKTKQREIKKKEKNK